MTSLQGRLAQADSQLRFGVDLAGQVSQGEATPELHEEAENSLWDALQQFFLLNQGYYAPVRLRLQVATLVSLRRCFATALFIPMISGVLRPPVLVASFAAPGSALKKWRRCARKWVVCSPPVRGSISMRWMQQRHGAMPLVLLRWQTAPLNRCTVHAVHSTLPVPIYLLATNSIGTSTGDMSSPSSGLAVWMVGRNVKSRESRV